METLGDCVLFPALIGAGLQAGFERARADRARDQAADAHVASQIRGAAAGAWSRVAGDLRSKLMGAELEIERLETKSDDLTLENLSLKESVRELLADRAQMMSDIRALLAENAALTRQAA